MLIRRDYLLESVRWQNNQLRQTEKHNINHIFIMTGADPNTSWLDGCIALDSKSFIKTGPTWWFFPNLMFCCCKNCSKSCLPIHHQLKRFCCTFSNCLQRFYVGRYALNTDNNSRVLEQTFSSSFISKYATLLCKFSKHLTLLNVMSFFRT